MSAAPAFDFSETHQLAQKRNREDRQSMLAKLFGSHRDRLRRMVQVRLDSRLKPRVDPSDLLQEVFLEASKRMDEYLRDAPIPLYLWFRLLARQKLRDAHRHHLRTKARDARREVSLDRQPPGGVSSAILADQIVGREATPSRQAVLAETKERLEGILEQMDPKDREIIALRHVEGLTNTESAAALEIQEATAAKRYFRAMEKLREFFKHLPGNRWDSWR